MNETGANKPQGEGIVAIIRRQERYLMIQRAHDLLAGGAWCFVGGAIEDGESQREALVRECLEEVGLEVEPVAKVYECLSFNKQWVLHCWEADPLGDQLTPDPREVADYCWCRPQEVASLPNVLPSVIEFFEDQGIL